MTYIEKPMLAGKAPADLSKLRYPLLASPKLDGIRCIIRGGQALTRKLKPIPNEYVRRTLESVLPDGLDGELLLPDMTAPFAQVSSAIMSRAGEPAFVFAVFDCLGEVEPKTPFANRLVELRRTVHHISYTCGTFLRYVPHRLVNSADELPTLLADALAGGFEGVMVRCPHGPYKFGRSTEREGYLLKIKAWEDEEATIVGVKPLMKNLNELTTDELGYAKRSSSKDGKVALPKLGALVCVMDDGAEVDVGSGFTDLDRIELWQQEDHRGFKFIGDRVKFKHQPPPGGRKPGEAPRFPIFLGFRHEAD